MRITLSLACLAITTTLILSGCSKPAPKPKTAKEAPKTTAKAKPKPELSDADAKKAAEDFFNGLVEQKFADVADMLTPQMAKALPEDKLKGLWMGLSMKLGQFEAVLRTRQLKVKTSQVVTLTCGFVVAPIDVRISVDPNGKIEGLFFRPAAEGVVRPQTPKGPFPYTAREVEYENKKGKMTIGGTLTLPEGKGPFPAALLITGSGTQDRDETIFGHKPFLVLADHLSRKGFVVLRVDDRGVGKTTGDPALATIEDHATDVAAGVAFLRKQKEVNPKKVGLIGHSEGGVIAPMVAAKDKKIAFVVSLAGTGLTGEDVINKQSKTFFERGGPIAPADLAAVLKAQKAIVALVKKNASDDKLRVAIRAGVLAGAKAQGQTLAETQISSLVEAKLKQSTFPWTKSFIKLDPAKHWKKVKCPALLLIGDKDTQVLADENIAAVKKACKRNKQFKAEKLASLNHLFQTAKTGTVSEYAALDETFHAPTLELIAAWLAEHVSK